MVFLSSRPATGRWRKPKSSNTAGQSFTPQLSFDTSVLQNSETHAQSEPGNYITTPVSLPTPMQWPCIEQTRERWPPAPTPAWEPMLWRLAFALMNILNMWCHWAWSVEGSGGGCEGTMTDAGQSAAQAPDLRSGAGQWKSATCHGQSIVLARAKAQGPEVTSEAKGEKAMKNDDPIRSPSDR